MSYIEERREEERERRRGEIVDAAERLYAERGWDGLTMDQVARNARLSRALVYVYFRDRDELLLAVIERALTALRERFAAAVGSRRLGIDQVEAVGRAYVAFSRELPHYFDACSRFQVRPDRAEQLPPQLEACHQASRGVHEILVAAIRTGFADGSMRADLGDPLLIAMTLRAFTHGIIQLAATKGELLAREGIAVPTLVENAFAMLRRSMTPR